MNSETQQQVFNLQLSLANTFETFYVDANSALVSQLQAIARGEQQEPQIFIWGASNTGKTHLLQAVCHLASQHQQRSIYIPLAKLPLHDPEIIQGFESMDIVCIDDVHLLANNEPWEQALFNFINQARAQEATIVISSQQNPAENIFTLSDLNSRTVWGPVYKLYELLDYELEPALLQHAKSRGIKLSDEVRKYIFIHCRRDIPTLVGILDALDHASLQEKRKITVPFLKKILAKQ